MSYIGNARSLLIIGSNTRDDLVPQFEGQQTFELSQEVPGGYENSIAVLKQKYIIQNIIFNYLTLSDLSLILKHIIRNTYFHTEMIEALL